MVMKLYGMQNIFNVQRAILPLFEVEVRNSTCCMLNASHNFPTIILLYSSQPCTFLKVDTEKELQLVKVNLFTQDNLQPAFTAKQVLRLPTHLHPFSSLLEFLSSHHITSS
jgi:hypothetical protein